MQSQPPETIHVNHGMKAPSSVALMLWATLLILAVCAAIFGTRMQSAGAASGGGVPGTIQSVRVLRGKATKGITSITVYIAPEFEDQGKRFVEGAKIELR